MKRSRENVQRSLPPKRCFFVSFLFLFFCRRVAGRQPWAPGWQPKESLHSPVRLMINYRLAKTPGRGRLSPGRCPATSPPVPPLPRPGDPGIPLPDPAIVCRIRATTVYTCPWHLSAAAPYYLESSFFFPFFAKRVLLKLSRLLGGLLCICVVSLPLSRGASGGGGREGG